MNTNINIYFVYLFNLYITSNNSLKHPSQKLVVKDDRVLTTSDITITRSSL